MCNWSHRWFRPSGALTAVEIGEIFADMVLGGLMPPAPAASPAAKPVRRAVRRKKSGV
jgi:hypothetical protein